MNQAEIVDVEPQLAAIVRKGVAFPDMPAAQRAARMALASALSAANAEPAGPNLTVWRPPVDGTIDYAPGVFVADEFKASGEVTLFRLPQGRAAHLRFEGPYEALPGAWGRLFEHCKREGWNPAGLNWEVYAEAGTTPITDLYAQLA